MSVVDAPVANLVLHGVVGGGSHLLSGDPNAHLPCLFLKKNNCFYTNLANRLGPPFISSTNCTKSEQGQNAWPNICDHLGRNSICSPLSYFKFCIALSTTIVLISPSVSTRLSILLLLETEASSHSYISLSNSAYQHVQLHQPANRPFVLAMTRITSVPSLAPLNTRMSKTWLRIR